jgi:hypothetical protein
MSKIRHKFRTKALTTTAIPVLIPNSVILEARKEASWENKPKTQVVPPPKRLYDFESFNKEVERIVGVMGAYEKAARIVRGAAGEQAQLEANIADARRLLKTSLAALEKHEDEVSMARGVFKDQEYKNAEAQLAELQAAARKILELTAS